MDTCNVSLASFFFHYKSGQKQLLMDSHFLEEGNLVSRVVSSFHMSLFACVFTTKCSLETRQMRLWFYPAERLSPVIKFANHNGFEIPVYKTHNVQSDE